MPVYEYRCADCQSTFEKLIRSQGQSPGPCPSCGREQVSRVFSTFTANVSAGRSSEAPRCGNPQPGCGRCG